MAVSPDYRDYVLELLAPLGGLRHTVMFGGVGIYSHDFFFAPLDALEDPDLLVEWARKGVEAAMRAKTDKKKR